MADSFVEKIFCKTPIIQRDGYLQDRNEQAAELARLALEITNIEGEKNTLVGACSQDKAGMALSIKQLAEEKTALTNQLSKAQADFSSLQSNALQVFNKSREFWSLSSSTMARLNTYESKYSKVLITYPARYVGNNVNNGIEMDVKPFLDCGKNDQAIQAWGQEHNCRVEDVLKDYPAKTYDQACEISAVRVQARTKIPYGSDTNRWGRSEFWEYATEVEHGVEDLGLAFDCDSHANHKHVRRRTCGIPDEIMRLVTGTTFTDEGHATNSMFFPSLGYFVHLNSTGTCKDNDDIFQFKRMGDSSETLNIKTPWWSSTSRFSHMQTITEAQATEMGRRRHWRATKSKREHQNRLMVKAKFYSLGGQEIKF